MDIICVICHDDMKSTDLLLGTRCGHVCHSTCINDWLKRSLTCPHCRMHLHPRDVMRIYLNFVNSENSLVDNILKNHKSELNNLQAQLEQKDSLIQDSTKRIQVLDAMLRIKDANDRHQKHVITGLSNQLDACNKKAALFSQQIENMRKQLELTEAYQKEASHKKEIAMLEKISELEKIYLMLIKEIAEKEREINLYKARCLKLEASTDESLQHLTEERARSRQMERRIEGFTREHRELQTRLAQLSQNARPKEKTVAPKARAPLAAIDQNKEQPARRYNLRPR